MLVVTASLVMLLGPLKVAETQLVPFSCFSDVIGGFQFFCMF